MNVRSPVAGGPFALFLAFLHGKTPPKHHGSFLFLFLDAEASAPTIASMTTRITPKMMIASMGEPAGWAVKFTVIETLPPLTRNVVELLENV